jgi:hypothetical protein
VAGESTDQKVADRGRDLPEECRAAAASGLWLLYSEVFASRSRAVARTAFEALTLIEPDERRLKRVHEVLDDELGIVADW